VQLRILIANKITSYRNESFSDRTFFTRPHKIALLPTRACGATRWLNPQKALIQLSLRHKTDDHLWFAFFHESGHILLHGKRDVFLEGKGVAAVEDLEKEEEANKFAADILIPPIELKRFLASGQQRTKVGIEQFAAEIGIAPGIVVGRLQHDGILLPSQYSCSATPGSFLRNSLPISVLTQTKFPNSSNVMCL
jgi:hypothetical protein